MFWGTVEHTWGFLILGLIKGSVFQWECVRLGLLGTGQLVHCFLSPTGHFEGD